MAETKITTRQLAEGTEFIQRDGSVPFTADQPMGGNKVTGLGAPTADGDAATKLYVDSVAKGLDVKDSVRCATLANIASLAGGAPNTVDGVSLAVNDRILVKAQSTGSQNGIYKVDTVGTGANGSWSRTADADADAEVTAGMFTFIEEGATLQDTGWVLITDNPITVGTTALSFTQFTGGEAVTGGAGLTKTGSVLDVNVDNVGIEIVGDNLQLKDAGVTTGKINAGAVDDTKLASNAVTSVKIAADAVTAAKINPDVAGPGIAQGAGGELQVDFAAGETPGGAVNGVNITFTLANSPVTGSLMLFLNGIFQKAGGTDDYTIAGSTITMATAPVSGDVLQANYFKA